MFATSTPSETVPPESRPRQAEDHPRLNTSTVIHGDTPSWEAVERMKDECDANEKLVTEALAEKKYFKAADYHWNTIKLKQQLSPRFPFLKMARIAACIKQLEILLECTESPRDMQSLLPSNLEELLQSDCQPLEREDYGHLNALLGSFYMRSRERQDWGHAKEYLDRALRHLVEVSPLPVAFIAKTAQNLVDMLDLMDDHAGAEGRLQWLKRRTLPELTDGVKVGRISATKLWCEEQGFSVQRFDEVEPSKCCSPLAHAVKKKGYRETEIMLSFTEETSPPNDLASELLLLAADTRSSELARLLITHGARLAIEDDHGKTVLHRCQYCPELGNLGGLKMANLFLDKHGDLLDKQDQSGKTALYMACESGHFDMADLLLKRGANPNIVEANGKTALYMACEKGQLNIVQRLLQQHADPNTVGPGNSTPIMVAVMMAANRAEKNRLGVVKELIRFHADPRRTDHKGRDAFRHVGGPLSSELKRALKASPQAEPSSERQPIQLPGTEVDVSGSGNKTGHRPLFSGNSSTSSWRHSSFLFRGSNATSSSKSNRNSIFSDSTSISNVTRPDSDTNNEDQISSRSLSKGISKGPDPRWSAPSNLPAISETPLPRQPNVTSHPSGNRDSESRYPANIAADNTNNTRPGMPAADLDTTLRYSDSSKGRGPLSSIEGASMTETSSLCSYSETGSEVISEPRHSSRQNLPRTLLELFPIAAQQLYRQHPGTSGAQGSGSGARGWTSNSPSGNPGHGARGSFSTTRSNYGRQSRESDRNGDLPDEAGMDGDHDSEGSSLSFACPFAKEYTARYFSCNFHKLTRIKDVKQHLQRNHKQPQNCPACRMQFSTEGEKDQHIRERGCQVSDQPAPDGITNEQITELKRRVNSRSSKEDQWYEVFWIVLPNAQSKPSSPFVERDYGLYDFASQHGRPIVRAYLQQSNHSRDAESLETLILIVVQHVIGAFLKGRSPNSMPGSSEGSSGSEAADGLPSTTPQTIGGDTMDIENNNHLSPGPMITSPSAQIDDTTQWPSNQRSFEEPMHNSRGQMSGDFYHPDLPTPQRQNRTDLSQYNPAQDSSLSLNWENNMDGLANSLNPMSTLGPMILDVEDWYSNQSPSSIRDPSRPNWGQPKDTR
ncbi:hypothetical protein BGZ61DRAFT_475415 [Ilyonectria robusta]|uniref:uncharacterized protein n=1 Tax=Ilyonectria robusta TaxID=1079257 RepID=UPI001E8ECCA6|nr:uncharacterized protein BGZ61DRAFT_475415 [Ilyonectria robusta]KAH8729852.1 hypothetical protein BGZ61DRAFT_475415 [Ilyonectria robusta]